MRASMHKREKTERSSIKSNLKMNTYASQDGHAKQNKQKNKHAPP